MKRKSPTQIIDCESSGVGEKTASTAESLSLEEDALDSRSDANAKNKTYNVVRTTTVVSSQQRRCDGSLIRDNDGLYDKPATTTRTRQKRVEDPTG